MPSIGSQLFESSSDSGAAPAAIVASTGDSPGRTFKFESAGAVKANDMKSKIKLAGFALVVVACVSAVMWVSVREKNGEAQKPILAKMESKSHLQIPSGASLITEPAAPAAIATPAKEPAVAQASETNSPTVVATGASESSNAFTPLPNEAKAETVQSEPAPTPPKAVAKPRPRIAKAVDSKQSMQTLVPLLVRTIDEREVVVEFEGTEYVVKRGQKLPDGHATFVGYDKTESVMRTTAGDFRIGRM